MAADTGEETAGWLTFADRRSAAVFAAGLIAGILLTSLLVGAGIVQHGNVLSGDRISSDVARQDLQQYLADNTRTLQQLLQIPADVDTRFDTLSVERSANGRWYRVSVNVTVAADAQTRSRTIPLYLTRDGRFLLFNPPVDLSQELSGQIQ